MSADGRDSDMSHQVKFGTIAAYIVRISGACYLRVTMRGVKGWHGRHGMWVWEPTTLMAYIHTNPVDPVWKRANPEDIEAAWNWYVVASAAGSESSPYVVQSQVI